MEIVATGFGGPDMLKAVETRVPPPGPGEVTIEVRAAGVNARDWKIYGDRSYAPSHGQEPPGFPLRMGVEAAGIVSAVGEAAGGPAGPIVVGDEVIAYRITGGYADQVTVPGHAVVPKPANLSWEQGAAMMLAGTTAAHVLAAIRARRGQTVLVHGASGGVGASVLQLARFDGVRVIGTSHPRRFHAVARYGAVPVAYGDGLLERVHEAASDGIDGAIDLVGTKEAIDVSLALVRDRARIATIVDFERGRQAGIRTLGGASGQDHAAGVEIRMAARLKLTALAQAGQFEVSIARRFGLGEAEAAHRLLAEGGAGGRIVLVRA